MTVAWITGGGTGIGRALAKQLYSEGARVVISGRRGELLEEAAREITASKHSGEIRAIVGDAADPSHVSRVVADVKSRWGGIDLLVNNAGTNANHSLSDTPVEEYREALENNCLSAIRATSAVLPGMRAARRGAIINISSIYGRWASSTSASYSVSKYALSGYTDALRQGLVGSGVHVMGVFPGYIRTAMTTPFVQPGSLRSSLGKTPEELAAQILRALRREKRELYYPWYVPWVLRLHRWMPAVADRAAGRVKR